MSLPAFLRLRADAAASPAPPAAATAGAPATALARATALALATALVTALPTAAAAQSGPFTDGELLVLAPLNNFEMKLYRIAPETGDGEVFLSPNFYGGGPSCFVFDSYRGALLFNWSLPPQPAYDLWLVASDGTAAAIPGFTGKTLRGMTSTGDGRIFYQRDGADMPIQWLDAANGIHTLLDATGTAPFLFPVDHMLYLPASNALIATKYGHLADSYCASNAHNVFRIPLSADGTEVAGPVTCASVGNAGEAIVSLDVLPGGAVLATHSVGSSPFTGKLWAVDPGTLAASKWAEPYTGNISGGCWSSRVHAAIVLDDLAGQLRKYGQYCPPPNVFDFGTVIVDDVPLAGGGGYSPNERMLEIDVFGPSCEGFHIAYGTGLAGTGAYVPKLSAAGCPDIGKVFTLLIDDVRGGALGALFVGLTPAALPFKGGTLLVAPILLQIGVLATGTPGMGGAGDVLLPAAILDAALSGIDVRLQAAFLDPGAVQGISLSNGLWVQPN